MLIIDNVDHIFHRITVACFPKEATRHTHGHCDEAKVVSRLQEHRRGWMGTGLIYIHVTHHLYILGGGFKDFLFSPLPGEMIQFD